MAVTRQTLQLEQRLRSALAAIFDSHEQDLVRAWVTAWDTLAPELTALLEEMLAAGDGVTRTQLLRSTRLTKALAAIADELDDLFEKAGRLALDELQDLVDAAGAAQAEIIASQLPATARKDLVDLDSWTNVDKRQIAAIVKRTTGQITSGLKPLSSEATTAVRRELIRGVATGANPVVTARRMVRRAEGRFNGGMSRALNIARTETLDAHRAAAAVGQAQHKDVMAGWIWLAQLTTRTCPACFARHGTEHRLSEPGPEGHQQCRCSRMPKTKTWADLGIDVDEPDSVVVDAGEYFDGLTTAEQQAILGPTGYQAWKSGKFPITRWAVKKKNPGWRDSWVVAQPPKAGRGRKAA